MEDIIDLYIGEVKNVVEAGACDCADSRAMAVIYPKATIFAFEPNPEMTEVCQKAATEEPRIKFTPVALGEQNGMKEFLAIDREKTTTIHADGNPGASSFLPANPDYPMEKYVQKPVNVMMTRFDDLNRDVYPVPDLLWLDAQGYELSILIGFGDLLKDVKVIKMEVLFKEQYFGAPLFEEVEEWMDAHGFRFVRMLEEYEWFGDAVFVNKNL